MGGEDGKGKTEGRWDDHGPHRVLRGNEQKMNPKEDPFHEWKGLTWWRSGRDVENDREELRTSRFLFWVTRWIVGPLHWVNECRKNSFAGKDKEFSRKWTWFVYTIKKQSSSKDSWTINSLHFPISFFIPLSSLNLFNPIETSKIPDFLHAAKSNLGCDRFLTW